MTEPYPVGRTEESFDALVSRYCEEAKHHLASAGSLAEASDIVERLCNRFEAECDSSLVANATRHYLRDFIVHRWAAGAGHGSLSGS